MGIELSVIVHRQTRDMVKRKLVHAAMPPTIASIDAHRVRGRPLSSST